MPLTHVVAIRNALADLVVDAVDAGTTDPNGDIQIAILADFVTILATLEFANPAFGAAAAGVATANAIAPDTNAAGTGSAGFFRLRDRDNAEVLRGTVTVTGDGGDLQLSSIVINPADTVSITSMTYAASP
jgi:hypothetical protein